MSRKAYHLPISPGILAHRERMGAAIWVYLWMIDKVTDEMPASDGDGFVGHVLGGRPLRSKAIADDLGMGVRSVQDHLGILISNGYVERSSGRTDGLSYSYSIRKSKKFEKARTVSLPSYPAEKFAPPQESAQGANDSSQGAKKSSSLYKEEQEEQTEHISPDGDGLDAALREVWDYYIAKCDRHPSTYAFSDSRRQKGLTRLRECLKKTGSLDKAVGLMKLAVDGLANNPFNRGENDRRTKYLDWIDHLFKSYEQMEKRWNAA